MASPARHLGVDLPAGGSQPAGRHETWWSECGWFPRISSRKILILWVRAEWTQPSLPPISKLKQVKAPGCRQRGVRNKLWEGRCCQERLCGARGAQAPVHFSFGG